MTSLRVRSAAASFVVLTATLILAAIGLIVGGRLPGEAAFTVLAPVWVAGAVLAGVAALWVARPVRQAVVTLERASRAVTAGEPAAFEPGAPGGEISQLQAAFAEMAERLRSNYRTLAEEYNRLDSIVTYLADGLVIADDAGLVRLVNPAAAKMLQTSTNQAVGRTLMEVLRDFELAGLVEATLFRGAGTPEPRQVTLASGADRRLVQALAIALPKGPDGVPLALLVLQDVTELRRAELVRREFVANISHELRTPVAAIKALAETLADGALSDPDVAQDFVQRIDTEADGLAQLVSELLELSRIESGQLRLRLEPLDLRTVVANAAERLRPLAERQHLTLTIESAADVAPVMADRERFEHIVVNLVHNAVKFTPAGGVITVSTRPVGGNAVVTVKDTGAGIASDALPRLFERFYKADKARSSGGTGLGLAIAKHLVQAHRGTITAQSAGEGRGATFTVTVPLRTGE